MPQPANSARRHMPRVCAVRSGEPFLRVGNASDSRAESRHPFASACCLSRLVSSGAAAGHPPSLVSTGGVLHGRGHQHRGKHSRLSIGQRHAAGDWTGESNERQREEETSTAAAPHTHAHSPSHLIAGTVVRVSGLVKQRSRMRRIDPSLLSQPRSCRPHPPSPPQPPPLLLQLLLASRAAANASAMSQLLLTMRMRTREARSAQRWMRVERS